MTGKVIDDSITAEIVPVDLSSIIQSSKEAQFKEYGRPEGYDLQEHEKMLDKLKERKPQRRLQNDRIAREVVRAILAADRLIAIEGKDYQYPSYGAVVIPSWSANEVRERVYALMNEDGLLDFTFHGCGSPNQFCFQSELVYWKEKRRIIGTDNVDVSSWCMYVENPQLKEAVKNILKPFGAEKSQYVMPQKR